MRHPLRAFARFSPHPLRWLEFKKSSIGAQTPNPSLAPARPLRPAGLASRRRTRRGPQAEHAVSRAMATGPDLSSSSSGAAAVPEAAPAAAARKDRHIVSWSAEVRQSPVRF